jgi:hypothetical protein
MRYLILAPALLLAACGSNDKTVTIKGDDGKDMTMTVGEDDGTTTIKTEDGEAVIRQGVAGAKFPAFAPQYPGSLVTASANFSGKDNESGSMVTQETTDTPDKVMAFYKGKLTEAGMKIAMETNTPEGGMMAVESKEGGKKGGMMIIINKDAGGKTSITFTGGQ